MMIKKSENRRLLYSYYLLAGISMIFILLHGKSESFLKLYSFHNDFLNSLMQVITYFGDGVVALIIAFVFIFYRLRISIFLLLSGIASGLIAQLMKRFIFSDELRPLGFFRNLGMDIYQIPGFDMHIHHSFPSGHTATAFAVFFGLALFAKKSWQKISLLSIAAIAGYSRIYLGQHFLTDVVAGSVIGVFTSITFFYFVNNWKSKWLNLSIQSLLFK